MKHFTACILHKIWSENLKHRICFYFAYKTKSKKYKFSQVWELLICQVSWIHFSITVKGLKPKLKHFAAFATKQLLLVMVYLTSQSNKITRYIVKHSSNLNKLWLNRGWMDAFIVEKRLNLFSNPHIIAEILTADVGGCYDPIASQLPHVELMNSKHTIDLLTTTTNR